jgi:hypothetical protein
LASIFCFMYSRLGIISAFLSSRSVSILVSRCPNICCLSIVECRVYKFLIPLLTPNVACYLVTRQITCEFWIWRSVYWNIRQAELQLVASHSYNT